MSWPREGFTAGRERLTWIRRSKQLLQDQVDRLTRNPALRGSTMTDLDQWIEETRIQVADKTR